MKKVVILLALFLLLPAISATITFDQQPSKVYNLGETLTIPVTIEVTTAASGFFNMDLVCEGHQENFYRRAMTLSANNQEKISDASLILSKGFIGNMKGNCRIKASFGADSATTDEFQISDLIIIKSEFKTLEFSPEESIPVSGTAVRENGKEVNGFFTVSIIEDNTTKISESGAVSNGDFSASLALPKDIAAGNYLLRIDTYEEDVNKEVTNRGTMQQNIFVRQVPTGLEVLFETKNVEPGTNLKVKAILRDQTGEKIDSTSFISIKNENNKILEQVEVPTDTFHEFPIPYDQIPAMWKAVATSNRITSESDFNILEKKAISIDILDKTVTITNVGNVIYNDTAKVSIGTDSVDIKVYLEVGKSQKYILTAPDGVYTISVSTGSESATMEGISLTGKAVNVKKAPGTVSSFIRYPAVWIFILIVVILGTVVFIRRNGKREFLKSMVSEISTRRETHSEHEHPIEKEIPYQMASPLSHGSMISSRSPAEISTSIKGSKQEVALAVVNVRNLLGPKAEGNASETLQKIVDMAEDKRASTYEDNNHIVFVLSRELTKSQNNEKTALDIAQSAKGILSHHNKIFKQKIDFGISVSHGFLLGKKESGIFKFSSIDSTIQSAKKISSTAHGEILLDEKMNEKLRSYLKTSKHGGTGSSSAYAIKETRNAEENSRFVKSFSEKFKKEHGE